MDSLSLPPIYRVYRHKIIDFPYQFRNESAKEQHLLIVNQHISESRGALAHVNERGISLRHGALLDPWPNVVFCRQLERLADLIGTSNGRASDMAVGHDKGEGRKRQRSIIRHADLNKCTVETKETKILVQRHLMQSVRCVDNPKRLMLGIPWKRKW